MDGVPYYYNMDTRKQYAFEKNGLIFSSYHDNMQIGAPRLDRAAFIACRGYSHKAGF